MKQLHTLVLLLALPVTALASPVWKGDFETGNLSQWTGRETVSSNRLLVVPSPAREGRYALQVTVKQGDDPINASGNRNELFHNGDETEGSEYFYKWSTMFDANYPSSNAWQIFAQWHHDGCCGSPPLEFFVSGERIFLRVGGKEDGDVWNTPLVRDQWQDYILHVKWSSNPRVGFVELYYNGRLVLPKQYVATMYPGMSNYLKLGLYRDEVIRPDGVVYHDGMVQATSLEDVLPQGPAIPEREVVAQPQPIPPPGGDEGAVPDSRLPSEYERTDELGSPPPPTPGTEALAAGCSATGGSLGGMGVLAVLALGARLLSRRASKAA